MHDVASIAVVVGGFVGATVTLCVTLALIVEIVALLRRGEAPGLRAHKLTRPRWLLAGAVPVAAALVVVAMVAAAWTAHDRPGRANLRAPSTLLSASGGAAANPNRAKVGGPSAEPGAPAVPAAVVPYPSPAPVLVVFDGGTITLTGAVHSDAAEQRLSTLAGAYSKTPGATVVNHLTVDPRVPDSVGTRVIEMQAIRFATGSSEVSPGYAPELGRVVAVMKSLPNLTALVVGHADQRGGSESNLRLSQARASAVVEYLVNQGIGPDRLSAQGVGDGSLLTQQSDAAGLALNRRTEFVFYGLLAGV